MRLGNYDLLHRRSLESSHCGIETRDLVQRVVRVSVSRRRKIRVGVRDHAICAVFMGMRENDVREYEIHEQRYQQDCKYGTSFLFHPCAGTL